MGIQYSIGKYRKISVAFASLTSVIGFLVLMGWHWDISALKSILPGYISMKANTAIGLISLSFAIIAGVYSRKNIYARYGSHAFASFAAAIGIATLMQYATQSNYGIDEFLYADPGAHGAKFPPGRLAPVTAISFVMLAFASILILQWRTRFARYAHSMIYIGFILSFQAIVGYACGVTYSFGSAYYTQIALHTAIGLSCLCVALLLSQPRIGLMALLLARSQAGQMVRNLTIAAICVPPALNWLELRGEKLSLFDEELGTLFRVIANVVFLSMVIWKNGRVLQIKETETTKLHSELEATVEKRTRQVRASEERFRSVMQSAHDGVIASDPAGNIITWNRGAERIFGYRDAEIMGRPLTRLMPERFRAAHNAGINRVAVLGQSKFAGMTIELTGLHKDGFEFPIEMTLSTWESEGNIHFASVIRDITERQKTEAKIRQLNTDLAARERSAQDANRIKSEFLANMSHEIRTPINGVIGTTSLLLDTPMNPEQREYVQSVLHSANTLLTIINDILDLSKIEAGKIELEEIDFDLHQVFQNVESILGVQAAKKGITLSHAFAPNVARYLKGDPTRLRQVLINLAGNSLKFTERGFVKVSVSHLSSTNNLRFTIQDTGIGIAPEALGKMFQAFSQADASTSRRYGGTGLGLSICQRLVQQMGGTIGVESKQNEGSTFWFEIPFRAGTEIKRNNATSDSIVLDPLLCTAPILIAEDNLINQRIAIKLLEKMGLRAIAVTNGHAVLAALRDRDFALILMDCQMPEMDGFETTRVIRETQAEDPAAPRIPIIAMTANALKGDREKCLFAGMDDYISKPVHPSDLHAILKKWLEKTAASAKSA